MPAPANIHPEPAASACFCGLCGCASNVDLNVYVVALARSFQVVPEPNRCDRNTVCHYQLGKNAGCIARTRPARPQPLKRMSELSISATDQRMFAAPRRIPPTTTIPWRSHRASCFLS